MLRERNQEYEAPIGGLLAWVFQTTPEDLERIELQLQATIEKCGLRIASITSSVKDVQPTKPAMSKEQHP